MPFLNADGSINVEQMLAEANKGGGANLPDGDYVCRLLSAEIQDAKGENQSPLPGKKRLSAKFTILRGECEKQELYLAYNLFNNKKDDGSVSIGSSSGTVRFFADLNAIGTPYSDKDKGSKIIYDKDGNMAILGNNGASVELLKKYWMERVVNKIITISSKSETSKRKNGVEFTFALRRFVGLATAPEVEEEDAAEAEEAVDAEGDESIY